MMLYNLYTYKIIRYIIKIENVSKLKKCLSKFNSINEGHYIANHSLV